uniref:Uncharacterized protein n=1 Tax=Anguilla anguilla TaxID=7936 RepID=A0A0E9QT20_ANGAN
MPASVMPSENVIICTDSKWDSHSLV